MDRLTVLNLPSAWSEYIEVAPGGASCLGPRSGLEAQREPYAAAVEQLADPRRTTLVLVSRSDTAALREAGRAAQELAAQGIRNQRLVLNGTLSPAPCAATRSPRRLRGARRERSPRWLRS